MKRPFLLALALLGTLQLAHAQTYTLDKAHSSVTFAVDHMVVSETTGKFGSFTVELTSAANDFTDAKIKAAIDVASINTDNENRDKHLKSADFFDAEKFPQIVFESTSFTKQSGNKYLLKGNLTMRGVTKAVEIPVTYRGIQQLKDGAKVGFKGEFAVNRKDYGVNWNRPVDGGGLVVGEEVRITLNLEINKK